MSGRAGNLAGTMQEQVASALMRDREVAEMLAISRATFWRRVRAGTLPTAHHIYGLTRWRQAEIEAFVETLIARRDEGTSPGG